MDYTFLFYIFLSVVVSAGGSYILFSTGRTIAAGLYLLGMIALETYFGTRWFTLTGNKVSTSGSWPPSINVCPDYLSLYKDTDGTNYCVDTIGITNSSLSTTPFQPAKFSADGTYRPITDQQKRTGIIFQLYKDKTGEDRMNSLKTQLKTMPGVTWEGVWDGIALLGGTPPLPK